MYSLRKYLVVAGTLAIFSLPALARTDMLSWQVNQPVTIGTTQLKPGNYQLKAEEGQSELQVKENGRMVATIPVHWVQLPSKANSSEVDTDSGKVTEIHFSGTTAAIQFGQ